MCFKLLIFAVVWLIVKTNIDIITTKYGQGEGEICGIINNIDYNCNIGLLCSSNNYCVKFMFDGDNNNNDIESGNKVNKINVYDRIWKMLT